MKRKKYNYDHHFAKRGVDIDKYEVNARSSAVFNQTPIEMLVADALSKRGDTAKAHLEYARYMYGEYAVELTIKKM